MLSQFFNQKIRSNLFFKLMVSSHDFQSRYVAVFVNVATKGMHHSLLW